MSSNIRKGSSGQWRALRLVVVLALTLVLLSVALATLTVASANGVPYTVHFNTDGTPGSSVSSSTQTVAEGGNAEPVTATAPVGRHFTQWTGTPSESFQTTTANPVTVRLVSYDMTVTAHFAIDTHTIKAATSANGTIAPASQLVNYDSDSESLTITPNSGYSFASATDKNGAITTVPGSAAGTRQYKFTHVTADNTITATFAINSYTLSYGYGTGGSVEGSVTQIVNHGVSGTEVTATPSAGYVFAMWSDGVMTADRTDAPDAANLSVTALFAVDRPAPPYSVTWSPIRGGTRIQWAGSPDATGYQVWLGTIPLNPAVLTIWNPGRLLGTTGPSTCSLFVPEYLGPNASIYVVALGTWDDSLPGMGVYSAAVTPVQVGVVRFTGNSSKLTPGTKTALRRWASLMATQGFTNLKVSGYTAAHDHGSKAFRRRLSLKRAKNVKAYLAAQFRMLHANVSITTAGYGGTYPAASNSSAWGMARNRRAELLLK
jgi:hypothetical protein